jgi:cyanophycin synthetase
MNVANALAAAATAWAAGAHLHDIRQGLRTFSTSFFQAPGRLNEVELRGFKVYIDYCHNVDGMRRLAEFVQLSMDDGPRRGGGRVTKARASAGDGASAPKRHGRAIGVIGIPGDRRDEDQRAYGAIAAGVFDEIYVREDAHLRGRAPGESAANVLAGVREAQEQGSARTNRAEPVLNELEAAKVGIRRAKDGDIVVVCADDSAAVYREVIAYGRGEHVPAIADPGEFAVPEG